MVLACLVATELGEADILKQLNSSDVVSFFELSNAAQKLGFEVKSYQLKRHILEQLILIPVLVRIEQDPRFPHFAVIINHKGDFVEVLDPGFGAYISSAPTSAKNQF